MIKRYDFCQIRTGFTTMNRGFFEHVHGLVTSAPLDKSEYVFLNKKLDDGVIVNLRVAKRDLKAEYVKKLLCRQFGFSKIYIEGKVNEDA